MAKEQSLLPLVSKAFTTPLSRGISWLFGHDGHPRRIPILVGLMLPATPPIPPQHCGHTPTVGNFAGSRAKGGEGKKGMKKGHQGRMGSNLLAIKQGIFQHFSYSELATKMGGEISANASFQPLMKKLLWSPHPSQFTVISSLQTTICGPPTHFDLIAESSDIVMIRAPSFFLI